MREDSFVEDVTDGIQPIYKQAITKVDPEEILAHTLQ